MAMFPFYVDLRGKKGLVVGGGALARRKIEALLPFKPMLRVVANDLSPEIVELAKRGEIVVEEREFAYEDLDDEPSFLIIATNDSELNRKIANEARPIVPWINVVDSPEDSTFYFPALIARKKLTIAVSTAGASPTVAADIRDRIEETLPENIEEVIEWLADIRAEVKERVATPELRKVVFASLYHETVARKRPLTRNEIEAILRRVGDVQDKETRSVERSLEQDAPGCVTIVGAGCGDASLITLRGLDAIRKCDAILYDELIDKTLLSYAPHYAERIPVGKRAGEYYERQETINSLLVALARSGKRVVRLKGGDPYLFGRGGEEARALLESKTPFDVVPGVTSAIYIPMEAGVPVTYRGLSRSVHIIAASNSEREFNEDIRRVASTSGTVAILMGTKRLDRITRELIEGGMRADTPVAVVRGGCAGPLVVLRGTLSDIVERTRECNLTAPTVIVVGEVARLDLRSTCGASSLPSLRPHERKTA